MSISDVTDHTSGRFIIRKCMFCKEDALFCDSRLNDMESTIHQYSIRDMVEQVELNYFLFCCAKCFNPRVQNLSPRNKPFECELLHTGHVIDHEYIIARSDPNYYASMNRLIGMVGKYQL